MSIDLEKDLLPPPDLVSDGSSSIASYIRIGAEFMRLFQEYLPLKPDMQVLEMGSAVGRISRRFIPFLSSAGRFTGIEIMPAQVAWCNEQIAGRFPNFRFLHADLYNKEYNPAGSIKASGYRFPFAGNELDLVILTSVFTHMLRRDVAHYLSEINRVLKPGGHCFATFFSYSRDEITRIHTDDASPRFMFPIYMEKGFPVSVSADNISLEDAVAYENGYIGKMYAQSGLSLLKELPGDWLKRDGAGISYQDIFISAKR